MNIMQRFNREPKGHFEFLEEDMNKLRGLLSKNLDTEILKGKGEMYKSNKKKTVSDLHDELAIILKNFATIQECLYINPKEIGEKKKLLKKTMFTLNSIKFELSQQKKHNVIDSKRAEDLNKQLELASKTTIGCKSILSVREKYPEFYADVEAL